jgi:hypothetical protein
MYQRGREFGKRGYNKEPEIYADALKRHKYVTYPPQVL